MVMKLPPYIITFPSSCTNFMSASPSLFILGIDNLYLYLYVVILAEEGVQTECLETLCPFYTAKTKFSTKTIHP